MQIPPAPWTWLDPASGTYSPQDVRFLLAQTHCPSLDIAEKEAAIAQGRMHYSECVTKEAAPSSTYLAFYHQAMQRHTARLAKECIQLAQTVMEHLKTSEIIWVSLARAGTPIGILLHRWAKHHGLVSTHYSVSVLKGKGLDLFALEEILRRHPKAWQGLVWVDGWIGKGSIRRQIQHSLDSWNKHQNSLLNPPLAVITDPTGCADICVSREDYLLPHALLNATISGCISRTTMPLQEGLSPHGTQFFDHLTPWDQSKAFIDTLWNAMLHPAPELSGSVSLPSAVHRTPQPFQTTLRLIQQHMPLQDESSIKVGIPETTRVFLRRSPAALWLKEENHPDTAHLTYLAQQQRIPIMIHADLPYQAAGVLQSAERE